MKTTKDGVSKTRGRTSYGFLGPAGCISSDRKQKAATGIAGLQEYQQGLAANSITALD